MTLTLGMAPSVRLQQTLSYAGARAVVEAAAARAEALGVPSTALSRAPSASPEEPPNKIDRSPKRVPAPFVAVVGGLPLTNLGSVFISGGQ